MVQQMEHKPKEHLKLRHLQSSRQHLADRSSHTSIQQEANESESQIKEVSSKVNLPTPSPPLMKPLKVETTTSIGGDNRSEHIPLTTYIHKTRLVNTSVIPIGEGLVIATPATL